MNRQATRRSLLTSTIIRGLLLGLAGPALAAETVTAEPAEGHPGAAEQVSRLDELGQEMRRVQMTGSRIHRAMLEGVAASHSLGRADIHRSGLSSLGDILQRLTTAGSALNTRFNSSGNFGFPPDSGGVGAGATTVDLRHLGCKRVLVLVDGRWVAESSASGVSSCSDLNTIPLAIIERIDLYEDGASSIYGSDAVAGVINIVTRRDVSGQRLSLFAGGYDQGDGQVYSAAVSGGDRFGDLSVFWSLSSLDQHAVRSSDRAISRFPVPGTGNLLGSAATPDAHVILRDPVTGAISDLIRPGGNADATIGAQPFVPFSNEDRYNFAAENLAQTPSERDAAFISLRYEFGAGMGAYLRGLYNRRQSENRAAPEPIFLGAAAGTGNPLADQITISAQNPFNPFGVDLRSTGDDANLLLLARRPVEGGPRLFSQDVRTRYLAFGLEGEFEAALGPWYWDINVADSRNRAEQINLGSYNLRNIALALGPIADCRATPGCTPLNLFGGPGTITDEMLAYIQAVVRDRSHNDLRLYSANLTGDLWEAWAGPMALAAGLERREVEGAYQPDAITVAGDYNGVPSLPTRGRYAVNEAYVEADLPLMVSVGSQLDLNTALRYSDYSTSSEETTLRAGLRWQFNNNLLLRGTWAEGFRGPSIGELFGAAARFDTDLRDPCLTQPSGAPPSGDCSAFGVPPGAMQSNTQVAVTTGGNPALRPEHSDSYSLGLVYSPAFANRRGFSDRLDIEINWYKHQIDDAIQAINPQTQLDLCVAGGPDSPFCDDIERSAAGSINRFVNRLQNFGRVSSQGFDLNLAWLGLETRYGQPRVQWWNSVVTRHAAFDGMGHRQPIREGVIVDNVAIPEWTSMLSLAWVYGDFDLAWSMRHFSQLEESCGRATEFDICGDPRADRHRLGSLTYHDVQVRWAAPWFAGSVLSLGVNNVGDKQPTACLSCSLNGYDASTYDLPGRWLYLRAELNF